MQFRRVVRADGGTAIQRGVGGGDELAGGLNPRSRCVCGGVRGGVSDTPSPSRRVIWAYTSVIRAAPVCVCFPMREMSVDVSRSRVSAVRVEGL